MSGPYVITTQTIRRTVGVDSKGLKHRVKRATARDGEAYMFTSVCDAANWDTLDLRDGSPTCVRCMCLP